MFGKTGQKPIGYETRLVGVTELARLEALHQQWGREVQQVAVTDERNQVIAYLVTTPVEKVKISHPFYIAAAVLAHSRVHMSKALLKMGGYHDPAYALRYTDTDSLLVTSLALTRWPADWIGPEIGKFKNDLPLDAKILRMVVLAPKVYALLYVTSDNKFWVKIRCKGIPHDNDPVQVPADAPLAPHEPELAQRVLAIARYREDQKHAVAPHVDLKFRAYVVRLGNGQETVTSHLCIKAFEWLLEEKVASISCYYGSLKIHYGGFYGGGGLSVQPRIEVRQLADTLDHNWWKKGHRTWNEELQFTVPRGYHLSHGK